jgi:glycosyltransferase involved in cell wall biosynthesis
MAQSSKLKALQVRGPFKGPSGYEHHVREFVRELVNQGVEVQLIDLPMWGPAKLPPAMRDPWFETLDKPVDARVVLHFCMPHQVVRVPYHLNVNYTMFEADRICSLWVEWQKFHDLIILPTESSRKAWIRSGVPAGKIRLCPLGIDPKRFAGGASSGPPPLPLHDDRGKPIDNYQLRFLNVSELGPRKNLAGLVWAWLRATSRRDDAVLILKLGSFAAGWLEIFQSQIDVVQQTLGKRLDDAAPIHLIHDLFSDEEMPRLYASATHYISMSFGEGWDQTMVEAAASGLSLIAPNHSAYTAYLDPSSAYLLPSRETPAIFPPHSKSRVLFRDALWWQPDEDAAVGVIQSIIAGTARHKTSPRDRILRDLTWSNATRRLVTLLSKAERRKTRRFWLLPRAYKHA